VYSSKGRFHQQREGETDERDAALLLLLLLLMLQGAEIRPCVEIGTPSAYPAREEAGVEAASWW
jgi:hypothetical protein